MKHKKTYVEHCRKCGIFVEIDDRYGPCPQPPDHTAFNERLARGDVALPFIPDYKKGENYPQRAINLKGEPMVSSYEDYKRRAAAEGQVETGISNESRYRMRRKAMKGKRQFFDVNAKTGRAEYKGKF